MKLPGKKKKKNHQDRILITETLQRYFHTHTQKKNNNYMKNNFFPTKL